MHTIVVQYRLQQFLEVDPIARHNSFEEFLIYVTAAVFIIPLNDVKVIEIQGFLYNWLFPFK